MQVRMGGVRCLAAILQPSAAGDGTPSAKSETRGAALERSSEGPGGAKGLFENAENQPLLAYTAHTLLGVAEGEAAAGAHGSRALRAAALRALRLLMERTGHNGAALAAILPGTASGLAKALQAASKQAFTTFEVLRTQLSDEHALDILMTIPSCICGFAGQTECRGSTAQGPCCLSGLDLQCVHGIRCP